MNICALLNGDYQKSYRAYQAGQPPIVVKKALRETQTLRAGCSKAEQKISAPPQTTFPGAQDSQNLISLRWSLLSPTDPVWWRSINAISSYL